MARAGGYELYFNQNYRELTESWLWLCSRLECRADDAPKCLTCGFAWTKKRSHGLSFYGLRRWSYQPLLAPFVSISGYERVKVVGQHLFFIIISSNFTAGNGTESLVWSGQVVDAWRIVCRSRFTDSLRWNSNHRYKNLFISETRSQWHMHLLLWQSKEDLRARALEIIISYAYFQPGTISRRSYFAFSILT